MMTPPTIYTPDAFIAKLHQWAEHMADTDERYDGVEQVDDVVLVRFDCDYELEPHTHNGDRVAALGNGQVGRALAPLSVLDDATIEAFDTSIAGWVPVDRSVLSDAALHDAADPEADTVKPLSSVESMEDLGGPSDAEAVLTTAFSNYNVTPGSTIRIGPFTESDGRIKATGTSNIRDGVAWAMLGTLVITESTDVKPLRTEEVGA